MAEAITPMIKSKLAWQWLVIAVIVSAGASAGVTYALVHKGNQNTVSASAQISQDLAGHKNGSALQAFNSQPASIRNSQGQQMVLESIYMSNKDYSQALATIEHIGSKWGWNYFLALQASQITALQKNYSGTITYDQKAVNLLQAQINTLQKVVQNTKKS